MQNLKLDLPGQFLCGEATAQRSGKDPYERGLRHESQTQSCPQATEESPILIDTSAFKPRWLQALTYLAAGVCICHLSVTPLL